MSLSNSETLDRRRLSVVCNRVPPRSANRAGEPQRHSRHQRVARDPSAPFPGHLPAGNCAPPVRVPDEASIKPYCCASQVLEFGAAPFGCVLRSQCCSPWCWVSSTHAQQLIQQDCCAAIHARPVTKVCATTANRAHGSQIAHSEPTAQTVAPEVIIHLHLNRELHRALRLLVLHLGPLWPLILHYCAAIHAHQQLISNTAFPIGATTAARAQRSQSAHSEPTATTVAPVLFILHHLRPPRARSTDALTLAIGMETTTATMADPDRNFPNAPSAPTVTTVALACWCRLWARSSDAKTHAQFRCITATATMAEKDRGGRGATSAPTVSPVAFARFRLRHHLRRRHHFRPLHHLHHLRRPLGPRLSSTLTLLRKIADGHWLAATATHTPTELCRRG